MLIWVIAKEGSFPLSGSYLLPLPWHLLPFISFLAMASGEEKEALATCSEPLVLRFVWLISLI